ncbi:MAG: hypothetical protein U9Q68_08200 [Euryarchaeota archaeon]|nr:hypothetical protein [Euryarchaeota archaeon]
MVNIGIPVPPGFTISTEACMHYYANDGGYPDGLEDEIGKNPLATGSVLKSGVW